MLKIGSYVLGALVLFAAVFALLPASSPRTETGATLHGVSLTLYPASDPDASWRFEANQVVNDPLSGETHLSRLKDGGRWLRERDAAGQLTGKTVLDARLAADDLTIDRQDNMVTDAATITLVRECAVVKLTGNDAQPVRVEQNTGFSAPLAEVDSPAIVGEVLDMRMTFDFEILESSEKSSFGWDMNAAEQCVGGERVPV
ncbi:hypothetical protein Deipr_1981 [Deinococcus proteolyticus MRP]|uniref:LPS export ABC transporter periplasmic protein LptC n=1 Tax=Deinococcus proteolyticus (strain ATCC 35074 / DSM 20540 / JCM 6276 / NBRC 101906 / NCIMB 13154 / VKM Ac-1939 / CCM 2703 / MRP) TaxID=693977 RepID=F0RMP4_DEIPM|nr:hypothetical protein [Deinococcus proteolyticus]ADY27112.1 hypothetical protein Deipr_1981 [Deinococcus proteolyticus MRP]